MKKGAFHSAGVLPIDMLIGRFRLQRFEFTAGGVDLDVTNFTWQLNIKQNKGIRTSLITLSTGGFGLSFPTYETNVIEARFQAAQVSVPTIKEGKAYWELIRTDTNEMWISGEVNFQYGLLDSAGLDEEVTVNLANQTISVELSSIVYVSSGSGGGTWGTITGTLSNQIDLNSALNGKQPIDQDLTDIAALNPSNDDFIQRKTGVWTNTTIAQVKTDLSISGTNTGDQTTSGTTNRITVATGSTNPVIDIAATFEALLGKVASPLSQFASTTSAQLFGIISDETGGTGVLVGSSSPAFTGTPTAPTAAALTSTTQLATTAFVTNARPFVTPEDFGAVGDGSTNDATALQNALNSGKTVFLGPKTYFISSGLTMPLNSIIMGGGDLSVIQFTATITALSVAGSNVIFNFKIKGPNAGATGASQIGIGAVGLVDGSVHKTGNKVANMTFENVGTGMYSIYTWTAPDGVTHASAYDATNLIFKGSYFRAITLDTRAEFNNFSNVQISGASTDGIFVRGGNNILENFYVVNSGNAFTITGNAGDNSGKNHLNNFLIGHNTNVGTIAFTDSMNFIEDSHLNSGGITLTSGAKVDFVNVSFGLTSTYTQTSATVTMVNPHFTALAATPFTISGTSIDVVNPIWEMTVPSASALAGLNIVSFTGGKASFNATNTVGGTTGNQTINKPSGTVNFAAAATAITVTNSYCTTASLVFAVVRTNDTTAIIKNVVPGSGSFVINLNAAATAETSVGFFIIN